MTVDSLLAREALILRLRLEFGLVGLEEIERWADAALLSANDPAEEVLNLSMARTQGWAASLSDLMLLGGAVMTAPDVVAALVTADETQLSAQEIRNLTNKLALLSDTIWDSSPEGCVVSDGYALSDAFALRDSGVFDDAELEKRISDFFRGVREAVSQTPRPVA